MTSLLARQFAEGGAKSMLNQYIMVMNKKPAKVIDTVIPGVFQNLLKSTESFLEGVASMDSEFIQKTSAKALRLKLLRQFQQMSRNQSEIRTRVIQSASAAESEEKIKEKEKKLKQSKNKLFTISPYVIFGQKFQHRLDSEDPWGQCMHLLSTNRFVSVNAKGLTFKEILTNHVFGFNCFYQNKNIVYEIVDKGEIRQFQSKIFVVSFETDSKNHEFFVSDFNFIIKDSIQ